MPISRLTLSLALLLFAPCISEEFRQRQFEKTGREIRIATETHPWGYRHLQEEIASGSAIDDIRLRSVALRTGRAPNSSGIWKRKSKMGTQNDSETSDRSEMMTAHARLIDDLVNRRYYEATVHPRRDHTMPTRVNVSMSLYQLLEVDERSQTITANVWMVQDWYDEFLDWDPREYELLNRTIVPYEDIWIPDTVLYNSGNMDKKNSEAVMNAIVETGHWRNDGRGAAVQLMFPAIYKLSCKMNVRFFPYDQQNCTFIISSWTHDMATIDYHYTRPTVNMRNYVADDEWTFISFDFHREELKFKCCARPWAMLYAHLVIRRRPLYYIVNLVVPTSIITVVAVIGFFTPSSSTSERDEKLYLGINTLLTMSLMLLMVTNQMPNTSNYVPLMGWYYMGIIFVIVFGTILATVVLFIHSRKTRLQPLPRPLLKLVISPWFGALVLEPPSTLTELWTEYGLLVEKAETTRTGEEKRRHRQTEETNGQKVSQGEQQDVVRKNQRQTLENILNKLNMKNFGLNYVPIMEQSASKRFALESGNVLVLVERMIWILQNVEKHRPGKSRPEYIFVFRDGLSEGQFAMACKEELFSLKQGCYKFDPGYKPKFVMVIGTKRHTKKFFLEKEGREGRPFNQNLILGSVIQDKVTRADITEHRILPSTASPAPGNWQTGGYCMLEDEIGLSMDELQGMIMGLSSHQLSYWGDGTCKLSHRFTA